MASAIASFPRWYIYLQEFGMDPCKLWPEPIRELQCVFLQTLAHYLELHTDCKKTSDLTGSDAGWFLRTMEAYRYYTLVPQSDENPDIEEIESLCGFAWTDIEDELCDKEDGEARIEAVWASLPKSSDNPDWLEVVLIPSPADPSSFVLT